MCQCIPKKLASKKGYSRMVLLGGNTVEVGAPEPRAKTAKKARIEIRTDAVSTQSLALSQSANHALLELLALRCAKCAHHLYILKTISRTEAGHICGKNF